MDNMLSPPQCLFKLYLLASSLDIPNMEMTRQKILSNFLLLSVRDRESETNRRMTLKIARNDFIDLH
jgi:hypothetical protein